MLRAEELDDPLKVEAFCLRANSAAAAMDVLHEWAAESVRLNCTAIGQTSSSIIPLESYVEACKKTIDTDQRFQETCRYLDRRGRDLLGIARVDL